MSRPPSADTAPVKTRALTGTALAMTVASLLAACGGGGLGKVPRPPGVGVEVNVSNTPGAQAETMIAVDPNDPQTLVAGANDISSDLESGTEAGFGGMRAFSSTDGGRTWKTTAALPLPGGIRRGDGCTSDPALAIDLKGRQYYGFIHIPRCMPDYFGTQVYVAHRANATSAWQVGSKPAAPASVPFADDKPMIVVDEGASSRHRDRLYLVFTRMTKAGAGIVITHSDDGARTWSRTSPVSPVTKRQFPVFAGLAVLPNGAAVATWTTDGVVRLARSPDGVRFGRARTLGKLDLPPKPRKKSRKSGGDANECHGTPLPAQPGRCITPGPTIAVDTSAGPRAGTIFTAWAERGADGTIDVVSETFSPSLHPGPTVQFTGIGKSDQMQPAIAVDRQTGTAWLCYYDSSGDWTRVHVMYTCTASRDGGQTWTTPIAAASSESDATQPGMRTWFNFGDYQGVVAAKGLAHPIWTDARAGGLNSTEIYTTTLSESAMH